MVISKMNVVRIILCLQVIISAKHTVLGARKFASDFLFGAATSSYQVEGAWNESDKGLSIWDAWTHDHPEKVLLGMTADIACDSYHFYKKDVAALKEMGATAYRFSLSWPRLLPTGYINTTSKTGKQYYNNLINELLKHGIQPVVTLFHWDTPEQLQRIGGFTNRELVDIYVDYADYAFQQFGDRVKIWTTFNEINMNCGIGYGDSKMAPGIGLPGRAEYLCGHYMLLAHAKAYRLYNGKYRPTQKGKVGIVHQIVGYYPLSSNPEHIEAAELVQDFIAGWVLHPIFSKQGDYPPRMKDFIRTKSLQENLARSRLPEFTPAEIELVRGSADFLGINYYTTVIYTFEPVSDPSLEVVIDGSYFLVSDLSMYSYQLSEWPKGDSKLLAIATEGFRNVLKYIKDRYNSPTIYITENGFPYLANNTDLNDYMRVESLNKHLSSLLTSIITDKVDVRGYMHWSLIDNFEWGAGYAMMYGLYAVNYTSPTKERIGRLSSRVYKNIIKTRQIDFNYLPVIYSNPTVI